MPVVPAQFDFITAKYGLPVCRYLLLINLSFVYINTSNRGTICAQFVLILFKEHSLCDLSAGNWHFSSLNLLRQPLRQRQRRGKFSGLWLSSGLMLLQTEKVSNTT